MGSKIMITRVCSDELKHHGISGQKWGVRRFQNEDGTYTEEGKKRYSSIKSAADAIKRESDYEMAEAQNARKEYDKLKNSKMRSPEEWLNEGFGENWKDKKYMQDAWNIDDPINFAKKSIESEREFELNQYLAKEQEHINNAKEWIDARDSLMNKKISDFTDSQMKTIEASTKELTKKQNEREIKDAANKGTGATVRAHVPDYDEKTRKKFTSSFKSKEEIHNTLGEFYNFFDKMGMPKNSLGDWTSKSEDEQLWYMLHLADQIGLI
jgi:hypothetical protein